MQDHQAVNSLLLESFQKTEGKENPDFLVRAIMRLWESDFLLSNLHAFILYIFIRFPDFWKRSSYVLNVFSFYLKLQFSKSFPLPKVFSGEKPL